MEINKIENIKLIDNINETKTNSFKRSIKLTNFLRKKGEKTQVTSIRNNLKDISRENAVIKRMAKAIKREYYTQF